MIGIRNKTGIVLLMTFLVILINGTARVPATGGDSYGTLLAADSLVRFGTLSLENYAREVLDRYGLSISQTHGLPCYYFPLESSILSVPLVGMVRLVVIDVLSEDAILQRMMASPGRRPTLK